MFTPRKFMDHRPYDGSFEAFETVPDIEAHRDDYEILSWELEPGDAIAFHMKTVHGRSGNGGTHHPSSRRGDPVAWG